MEPVEWEKDVGALRKARCRAVFARDDEALAAGLAELPLQELRLELWVNEIGPGPQRGKAHMVRGGSKRISASKVCP